MKKSFMTGLAILLPIFLTVVIVIFLVNFVTKPFSFFLAPEQPRFFSKLMILAALLFFVVLIGFLGRLFLVKYLLGLADKLIYRLPFVNKIYQACKDVIHGLLSSESSSFSQVVFVPFPTTDTLSIGLITRESILLYESPTKINPVIPVFIPGTPNPSVGFMLMFKKEELIFVDMKVEDAMKFVVSCGVVAAEFSTQSQIGQ